MSRLRTLLLLLFAAIALPAAAMADSIDTYYFQITGGTLPAAIDFQISNTDTTYPAGTFGTPPDELDYSIGWEETVYVGGTDALNVPILLGTYQSQEVLVFFPELVFFFANNDSSTFYNGVSFTPGDYSLTDNEDAYTYNMEVSDAPFSSTPEPSSLALLGTGLVGVGGLVRRRYLAS